MRCHFISIRMVHVKEMIIPRAGKDGEKLKLSYLPSEGVVVGDVK